ncbi:hypothetical protein P152DRAFT_445854 [Eremomyces bilateralis CBS 781.70]|uniref:Uncharacterized protein n=1 Tax=Eremomyces bilateralis CBS 781.70 TaxID=1392243 RepID=A0A6G1GE53_9PEZI|nr:uncharacterized protein P152DRAFT_445854 [Eremomyces bilateralis CBS 781.70]KAF1816171.1 hypothetical protein P152DRAFT_445854 [Eremomyces bilateralis CBS 781.70]
MQVTHVIDPHQPSGKFILAPSRHSVDSAAIQPHGTNSSKPLRTNGRSARTSERVKSPNEGILPPTPPSGSAKDVTMATYPWTPDRLTPANLQGPPTPETTPPTPSVPVRPSPNHYPSSAAESFKTAQEDLDSEEETQTHTPSDKLSTDLYYMTNGKLGLPGGPSPNTSLHSRTKSTPIDMATARAGIIKGKGVQYTSSGADRPGTHDSGYDPGMNGAISASAFQRLRHVHPQPEREVQYSPVRTGRNSIPTDDSTAVTPMRRKSLGPKIQTNLSPLDGGHSNRRSISDASPLSVGDSISHIRYDPRKPILRHVSKRESLRLRGGNQSASISPITLTTSNRSSLVSNESSPPHPLRHKSRTVPKKVAFGSAIDDAALRNGPAPSYPGAQRSRPHGRSRSLADDGDALRALQGGAVQPVGETSSNAIDSSPSKSSKSSGRSVNSGAPGSYLDDAPVEGKYATEPLLPPSLRNRDDVELLGAAQSRGQDTVPGAQPSKGELAVKQGIDNGLGVNANSVYQGSQQMLEVPSKAPSKVLRTSQTDRTLSAEKPMTSSRLKPIFEPERPAVKFHIPSDTILRPDFTGNAGAGPEKRALPTPSHVSNPDYVPSGDQPRDSDETIVVKRRAEKVDATEHPPDNILAITALVPEDPSQHSKRQDRAATNAVARPDRLTAPRLSAHADASSSSAFHTNSERSVSFDAQRMSLDRMSVKTDDHYGLSGSIRHQLTPGTPFSVYSDAPSAMEVSQATAINLYPHNNDSLLLVQQAARPGTSSRPQTRDEATAQPNDDSAAVKEATKNLNTSDIHQPTVVIEPSTPPDAHPPSLKDDSPLTNPRPAPAPPAPVIPPAFRVIPPTPYSDEDQQLGEASAEKPVRRGSVPTRRTSIKQRARRYSDNFIQPFARASFPFTRRGVTNPIDQRDESPICVPPKPVITIISNADPPKRVLDSPPQTAPAITTRNPLPSLLPLPTRTRPRSSTIDSTRSLRPTDLSNTLHPNWRPRPRRDSDAPSPSPHRYSLDDLDDPEYYSDSDSGPDSGPDPGSRLPPGGDTSDIGEARGLGKVRGKVLERFSSLKQRKRQRATSLPVSASPTAHTNGGPREVVITNGADQDSPTRPRIPAHPGTSAVGVGLDARAFLLGNSLGLDRAGTNRRKPQIAVTGEVGGTRHVRAMSASTAGSWRGTSASGMRRSVSASTFRTSSRESGESEDAAERAGMVYGGRPRGVEKGVRVPGLRGVRIHGSLTAERRDIICRGLGWEMFVHDGIWEGVGYGCIISVFPDDAMIHDSAVMADLAIEYSLVGHISPVCCVLEELEMGFHRAPACSERTG